MEYRNLGKSEIRVSAIGLGTWPVGGSIFLGGVPTGYGAVPESEAIRGIQRALELGVNFFDTADSYGLGRSERILAKAVASRRGQVVLATKAGWIPDGDERWMRDLSARHLAAAAARSCRRLGVEAIDVFQLHSVPEEGEETEEALGALEELKARGVIRLAGVSVGSDFAGGLRLMQSGRIDVVQVHFNLLLQGATTELLEEAVGRQVGIVGSIPLAYGFLSGRYTRATSFASDDWRSSLTSEEIASRVKRVREFRFLTGGGTRSMTQAALQFVLAHSGLSTTIPGFRNVEQVEELVSSLEAAGLSDIEVARARELGGSLRARTAKA
jgi:aryl-alcohol dehydrogenase-like predicted oxidoreductase